MNTPSNFTLSWSGKRNSAGSLTSASRSATIAWGAGTGAVVSALEDAYFRYNPQNSNPSFPVLDVGVERFMYSDAAGTTTTTSSSSAIVIKYVVTL